MANENDLLQDGMINRPLAAFTDVEGEKYLLMTPGHSITDVLNELINENGFQEVEEVLASIIDSAKGRGVYDDHK